MFQVVPSIDLRQGGIVRLQQGDYERQLDYDLDPCATAQSFEAAGAEWMHIVDLDGARQGAVVQLPLIGRIIQSCRLKVQVGGGVRSTSDVERLLDAGAARVVIGTKAIEDWPWFTDLCRNPLFSERVVLALDAKDGVVATRGWTTASGRSAVDVARQVSGWSGLVGILYTDVAKDGMLKGPNLHYTRLLAEATDVPVIASGGVSGLGDIVSLLSLPIWGVIIGRSLHDGRLNLAEAINVVRSGPGNPGGAAAMGEGK